MCDSRHGTFPPLGASWPCARSHLTAHDRDFQYRDELQTLPITYLCDRHRYQVDLLVRVSWPTR